jgi:hypothetical protein
MDRTERKKGWYRAKSTPAKQCLARVLFYLDFSLLSGERNKKPPAMRVANNSYTKTHQTFIIEDVQATIKKEGMVSLWLKV